MKNLLSTFMVSSRKSVIFMFGWGLPPRAPIPVWTRVSNRIADWYRWDTVE